MNPVKLDICARWERAECHEREDEENYPCDEIKEQHCNRNERSNTV